MKLLSHSGACENGSPARPHADCSSLLHSWHKCDSNLSACNLSFISNQQYAWYDYIFGRKKKFCIEQYLFIYECHQRNNLEHVTSSMLRMAVLGKVWLHLNEDFWRLRCSLIMLVLKNKNRFRVTDFRTDHRLHRSRCAEDISGGVFCWFAEDI